jgi:diguanylate cyclase (GGDEF)-like protein
MPISIDAQGMKLDLDAVFPFHLQFDSKFRVTSIGSSIQKLAPSLRLQSDIRDQLEIGHPATGWNFDSLANLHHTPISAELTESGLSLRYQVIGSDSETGSGGTRITLVGTLNDCSADTLADFGIGPDDFAAHDARVDAIKIRQNYELQLQNLQRVVNQLKSTVAERDALEEARLTLSHNLDASADLLIRFSTEGEILEVRAIGQGLLPNSTQSILNTHVSDSLPFLVDHFEMGVQWIADSGLPLAFEYSFKDENQEHFFDARFAPATDGSILLLSRDISSQRELESKLRFLATHDPLTHLPNRRLFMDEMETVTRSGSAAVLFVDLDDFKIANDTYGHAFGDEILATVANRLRVAVGVRGMAARLGGDEFAVLLRNVDSLPQAKEYAGQLSTAIAEPMQIEGRAIRVHASVGVTIGGAKTDIAEIFRQADTDMYRVKAEGKIKINHKPARS